MGGEGGKGGFKDLMYKTESGNHHYDGPQSQEKKGATPLDMVRGSGSPCMESRTYVMLLPGMRRRRNGWSAMWNERREAQLFGQGRLENKGSKRVIQYTKE
jgi:hypothetical protein